MRFDVRPYQPFQAAIAQLPGVKSVNITAKGPTGQQPAIDVFAQTADDAHFINDLVEDRIGICQVDTAAVSRIGNLPYEGDKVERAKGAIGGLEGVQSVGSDENIMVIGTATEEKAKFLSEMLEDNIYGKDVYFQVG